MKIIGFSDIITNSSSEVFTIYTEEGLEQIKKIVDAVLKVGGSELTFDDLFTIELYFDEDWAWDEYLDEHPDAIRENVSTEELLQFCEDHDNECYEDNTLIDGFSIVAKDKKNTEAAQLLNGIDRIFDHEERYC
jgi:hypothetical protein